MGRLETAFSAAMLPTDLSDAVLLGRVGQPEGPTPVLIRGVAVWDVVRIATPRIGALVNRVTMSKAAAPWTFGVRDLMRNLALRGLLQIQAA